MYEKIRVKGDESGCKLGQISSFFSGYPQVDATRFYYPLNLQITIIVLVVDAIVVVIIIITTKN